MNRTKKHILRMLGTILLTAMLLFEGNQIPVVAAAGLTSGARASADDVVAATSTNKKGIQGTEFVYGDHPDYEPSTLGVNHVLLNLELNNVINTDGSGTAYNYNGKTYYFNYENYVKPYEWRVKEFRSQGKAVTFVLLLGWSNDPAIQNLIYPGARAQGHYYYALNTQDSSAIELLDATFHFLTDVFGQKASFVQNWIIGNEVNMPQEYNYTGTTDLTTNVDICAASFDLLYRALKDNNPYGKAYISLTNHWSYDDDGHGMASRDFLDAFAAKETDKNWNIAFHAYPPNLAVNCWDKRAAEWLRHDVNSRYVCGANLEVLTDYVSQKYGASHRIILSEQGFDSNIGLDEQAAMMVYTYYAAARNNMVDAVIFASWQDSSNGEGAAIRDGYHLGLLDDSGKARPAYFAYRYMDTSSASTYVDKYLTTIGIDAWTDNMIYTPETTNAVLTSASLYVYEHDSTHIKVGVTTETSSPGTNVEYRWTAVDSSGTEIVISEWLLNNEWITWTPAMNDKYILTAEVRVAGNETSYKKLQTIIYYNTPLDASITSAEMVITEKTNSQIKAQINANATAANTTFEYCWTIVDSSNNIIPLTDGWKIGDNSIVWQPPTYGSYALIGDVRIAGGTDSTRCTEVLAFDPPSDATITSASLYVMENNRSRIQLAIDASSSVPTNLEYCWIESHTKNGQTVSSVIRNWSQGNYVNWTPESFGEYTVTAYVRVAGNPSSCMVMQQVVYFNPNIKGKCQMPYMGAGGGYLIGVESYENPNQSYQYEMLILDCTLLAEGKNAWVYSTGKFTVTEGCAGWTIWQPQYGYYWTLFRVYDAAGNMIDEACYPFVNAY